MREVKYHKNDLDKTIKELVDIVVEELNAAKESGEALYRGFTICTFTASSQFYSDYWHKHIEMLDKFQAEFDRRMGRNIDLDWYVEDPPCQRRHYRALFGVDLFTYALLE